MSSSSMEICFNANCNSVLERSRKGWRLRTGDSADLCGRCASAFEEGKFCEAYHMDASGWRCCESCGKKIHCGCIVSFHMFILLDAGGIECITCARKSYILTPNPAWPRHSLLLPGQPERIKDFSVKNWSQIAGSGPVSGCPASKFFNNSRPQSELLSRTPFDFDVPSSINQLSASERLAASSLENKKVEDSFENLLNRSGKPSASDILSNGSARTNYEEQSNPRVNDSQKPSFLKNDLRTPQFSSAVTSASPNDQVQVSDVHAQRITPTPPIGKQICGHNGADSFGEAHTHKKKTRGDDRGRNHLRPQYWPRITNQELQQISGDLSTTVTPLFEKILSASDAGRIGRLVLPKKCAEAYFPPISHPEGVPLQVQDLNGKEWIFQFRFWTNNNSRMYVLEGVAPCIQSMQLQAGDIVTFSRLEPEGKLIMGFKKATHTQLSDQLNETVNASNGVTLGDANGRETTDGEGFSTGHHSKAKDSQSSFGTKRNNSTLVSKIKCLKIENEDMMEVKITCEQAQELLRPPPRHDPGIMVIEGCEIEEYQEAPIIGRPTIFRIDYVGEKTQWAQCEDCFKWRKIPSDALLPSSWTCSMNYWDPKRSSCSAAQEITTEELGGLIPIVDHLAGNEAAGGSDGGGALESCGGLDKLSNLAIIQEEDPSSSSSSSQETTTTTTMHPRHRYGCTCVVCIQPPPSGKGPNHKQTCTCNFCLIVKRPFHTLMLQADNNLSLNQLPLSCNQFPDDDDDDDDDYSHQQLGSSNTESSPKRRKVTSNEDEEEDERSRLLITKSSSPFKAKIDLNMQPEEVSSGSDSGGVVIVLDDDDDDDDDHNTIKNSWGTQTPPVRGGLAAAMIKCSNHWDDTAKADHPVLLSMNPPPALASEK